CERELYLTCSPNLFCYFCFLLLPYYLLLDMTKNKEPFNASNSLSFTEKIRVRFNETDPLGIVWHGYYIAYFEDGREAFGRHFGISYLEIKNQGYTTPIVKSVCEHKLPLRYGEVATIETTFI